MSDTETKLFIYADEECQDVVIKLDDITVIHSNGPSSCWVRVKGSAFAYTVRLGFDDLMSRIGGTICPR